MPAISGFASPIEMTKEQGALACACCGMAVGQGHIRGIIRIHTSAEIGPLDVDERHLSSMGTFRIADVLRLAVQVSGGQADDRPDAFKGWRRREDRTFARTTDLSRDQSAAIVRALIVAFIDVHPLDADRGLSLALSGFGPRPELPDRERIEVLQFFAPGRLDHCIVEWLTCQAVPVLARGLHGIDKCLDAFTVQQVADVVLSIDTDTSALRGHPSHATWVGRGPHVVTDTGTVTGTRLSAWCFSERLPAHLADELVHVEAHLSGHAALQLFQAHAGVRPRHDAHKANGVALIVAQLVTAPREYRSA